MITVESANPLEAMESAIYRATQRHGARVITITPFRSLFVERSEAPLADAISFTVVHVDLYTRLMADEPRFAALLPCRIAAVRREQGTALQTLSPAGFAALLDRPELQQMVEPLEALLKAIMEEAAGTPAARGPQRETRFSLLGAKEGQGSMYGSIPQRIDAHGTKIEELGGTGKVDAPGG